MFNTLEGMRGLAAIAVVLFHSEELVGKLAPNSSYLAVDFFFLLSGFIMAHAYSARMDHGLTGLAFMRARIVRLYPLYLAGTLAGVTAATISFLAHGNSTLWLTMHPMASLPAAIVMAPSPVGEQLFPLDVPAWSLMFEVIANAVFAFRPMRSNTAMLCLMGAAGMALLTSGVMLGNLNHGWAKSTIAVGFARVFFSFPAGVLLYRVRHRLKLPPIVPFVPVLLFGAALYAAPTADLRTAYDLLFVSVISPALLVVAATTRPSDGRLLGVFGWLGAVSYPLYMLHFPVLNMSMGALAKRLPNPTLQYLGILTLIAALIAVSFYAAKIDRWIAVWISARSCRQTPQLEPT